MDWETLGTVPPRELEDTRLQLHWAAQLLGGAGRALAPSREDDSHTAAVWRDGALLSAELREGRRLGLDLGAAALECVPSGARFALAGRRLDEAREWVGEQLAAENGIQLPDYEMPPHPVAEGRVFKLQADPVEEIARWYGNLAVALEGLRAGTPEASPVRCWPHHFDLAFLTPLEAVPDPEAARSVGIGFSPGDGTIREPYLYALPWPRPECSELPGLPSGGVWWTDGFLSAVLRGTDLLQGEPGAQQERALGFLRDAYARSVELLRS